MRYFKDPLKIKKTDTAPTDDTLFSRYVTIEEFQKISKKLPADIAAELDHQKAQVESLQKKISPANDDKVETPTVKIPRPS